MSVVFVTSDEPSEVLEPAYRALDFPAASVSAELAAVLSRRRLAVFAVWAHQLDAASPKSLAERVAVRSRIIEQAARLLGQNALVDQRLDERHFVGAGAGDFCAQGKTAAVAEDHRLGPFAPCGLADAFAPFFAEENVPSAMASSQRTRPRRSSFRKRRAQAFFHRPASVQAFKRRQQVGGEGKWAGRSFHLAPVRSIHR